MAVFLVFVLFYQLPKVCDFVINQFFISFIHYANFLKFYLKQDIIDKQKTILRTLGKKQKLLWALSSLWYCDKLAGSPFFWARGLANLRPMLERYYSLSYFPSKSILSIVSIILNYSPVSPNSPFAVFFLFVSILSSISIGGLRKYQSSSLLLKLECEH